MNRNGQFFFFHRKWQKFVQRHMNGLILATVILGAPNYSNAQYSENAPSDFPVQCKALCKPAAVAYQTYSSNFPRGQGGPYDFYGCENIWHENGPNFWAQEEKKSPGNLAKAIASFKKTSSGDLSSYSRRWPEHDAYVIARDRINLCVANYSDALMSGASGAPARAISSNQATPSQQNQPVREQAQQAQQQSPQAQQAQQQSQQAQQAAQQNQARADQARQGQRKTNNPAAQAHSCIEIDKGPGLFGGFKNTCEYKVNYVFCNFGPKKDSWAEFHNCEKRHGIGADGVGPGRASAAHTKNTAMVYWFACRDPSWPVDSEFVLGKGIEARCH